MALRSQVRTLRASNVTGAVASSDALPLAVGNLRDQVAPVKGGRSSGLVTIIIKAGQTVPAGYEGNEFYFDLATLPIKVRTRGAAQGPWEVYTQGKGKRLDETQLFSDLDLWNDNAVDAVISLFVGFGDYIDNTFNVASSPLSLVAVPNYDSKVAPAATVDSPDLSATTYLDNTGKKWILLSRAALLVSNSDAAAVWGLYRKFGALVELTAFLCAYPYMSINIDPVGEIQAHVWGGGGGNLIGSISELYNAIPA